MLRIVPGGTFEATGATMKMLIEQAFDIKDDQLVQAPPWLDSEHYDVRAKPEDSEAAAMDKLPMEQRRDRLMQMMQSLLIERCKLEVGRETKELAVYALVVAKGGVKMKKSDFVPPDKPPSGPPPIGKNRSDARRNASNGWARQAGIDRRRDADVGQCTFEVCGPDGSG